MSDFSELPEGISINKNNSDFYIDVEFELIEQIECKKCLILYKAFLMTNASRHEGRIIIEHLDSIIWKNTLSKNKEKAIKNLKDNLILKFDRHKERCKND
jgi:hypothetical protein